MNIFARAVSLFEADYAKAQEWFTGDALPFLKNFFQTTVEEELVAIKPLAEAALAQIAGDLPAMLTGGPMAWAEMAGQVLLATASSVEAAGITVAKASLATAVHSVIANAQAALAPAAVATAADAAASAPAPAPAPAS